jgi:hypothetical protein
MIESGISQFVQGQVSSLTPKGGGFLLRLPKD